MLDSLIMNFVVAVAGDCVFVALRTDSVLSHFYNRLPAMEVQHG